MEFIQSAVSLLFIRGQLAETVKFHRNRSQRWPCCPQPAALSDTYLRWLPYSVRSIPPTLFGMLPCWFDTVHVHHRKDRSQKLVQLVSGSPRCYWHGELHPRHRPCSPFQSWCSQHEIGAKFSFFFKYFFQVIGVAAMIYSASLLADSSDISSSLFNWPLSKKAQNRMSWSMPNAGSAFTRYAISADSFFNLSWAAEFER